MDKNHKMGTASIPLPLIIIGLILFVWAIVHAILNRTSADFIKYSLYISSAASAIFIFGIIIVIVKSDMSNPTRGDVIMYLGMILASSVIGPIYYSVGVSVKDLYLWLQSPHLSKNGSVVMTLAITSFSGIILFYFRLRARSIYGITEAFVGLTVAANKVSSENSQSPITSNFYLAILTASVYLVVRGLDNIHQGLTKEPIDPYASKLLSLFKRRK